MVERATFDVIKWKHGAYASWAVWAQPTGRPKSNTGDLSVLDPEVNPALLRTLRPDVVMVALNLSRFSPAPFGNFHEASPESQDSSVFGPTLAKSLSSPVFDWPVAHWFRPAGISRRRALGSVPDTNSEPSGGDR